MSEYGAPHPGGGHGAKTPVSIGWVVAAGIVIGVALLLMTEFLIAIDSPAELTVLPGVALLAIGFLMLLNPRAGINGPSDLRSPRR